TTSLRDLSADVCSADLPVHSIVASAPAFPITGACVSTNVIVWLRVTDVLLHASTAFHVLVTVRAHAVPPVASLPTWFTVAPLHEIGRASCRDSVVASQS